MFKYQSALLRNGQDELAVSKTSGTGLARAERSNVFALREAVIPRFSTSRLSAQSWVPVRRLGYSFMHEKRVCGYLLSPLSMSNLPAQESLSGILGSISLASWLFVLVNHLPLIGTTRPYAEISGSPASGKL